MAYLIHYIIVYIVTQFTGSLLSSSVIIVIVLEIPQTVKMSKLFITLCMLVAAVAVCSARYVQPNSYGSNGHNSAYGNNGYGSYGYAGSYGNNGYGSYGNNGYGSYGNNGYGSYGNNGGYGGSYGNGYNNGYYGNSHNSQGYY